MVNDKSSTTSNNLLANAKGISSAEVNTHCSLTGKQRNHTSLQQPLLMFTINLVELQLSLYHVTQHTLLLREDKSLEHNLNRFWEVETMEQSSMTAEQEACEEHFHIYNPTVTRKICGQISNQNGTQSTRDFSPLSRAKIVYTERRLERHPELKIQYHNFMKKYEELVYRKPVNSQEGKKICYSLAHHPVFKETSSTTRNRISSGGVAKSPNGTQQYN